MKNMVLHLAGGGVLEFTGERVSSVTREEPGPAGGTAVNSYTLYRDDRGGYVLVLDRYLKVQAKTFGLKFNSLDDVGEYLSRDGGGPDIVRVLTGGDDERGDGSGDDS